MLCLQHFSTAPKWLTKSVIACLKRFKFHILTYYFIIMTNYCHNISLLQIFAQFSLSVCQLTTLSFHIVSSSIHPALALSLPTSSFKGPVFQSPTIQNVAAHSVFARSLLICCRFLATTLPFWNFACLLLPIWTWLPVSII